MKTKQRELACSPEQLLYYQAPVACAMLICVIPFIDDVMQSSRPGQTFALMDMQWARSPKTLVYVLGSATLAFLVNLSIFLVIGKTSPLSYNVLGHAKLVSILTSGVVLFNEELSVMSLVGIVLAVGGIVTYTHLKMVEGAAANAGRAKVTAQKGNMTAFEN